MNLNYKIILTTQNLDNIKVKVNHQELDYNIDKWFFAHKTQLVMNGKCNWFNNVAQAVDNIDQAIMNSTKINPDDIQFIVESPSNHDPELLQQYYYLRHAEFIKEGGFKNYNGFENEFDRHGKILLAKYQEKIIAGCRIGFASKGRFLSQEVPEQDYTYKSICQKANIDGVVLTDDNYAEVSGLVAIDYKNQNLLELLLGHLFDFCQANKIQYVFGTSDFKHHLEYKIALKQIGYKSVLLKNFIAHKKL